MRKRIPAVFAVLLASCIVELDTAILSPRILGSERGKSIWRNRHLALDQSRLILRRSRWNRRRVA